MSLLKRLFCTYFGFCDFVYNRSREDLVHRYDVLESRADRLWRPRDFLDVG